MFISSTPRVMMLRWKLADQPEELARVLDNHGHQEARAEVLASTWAERIEGFMKGGSAATFRKTERERGARTLLLQCGCSHEPLCCNPRGVCVRMRESVWGIMATHTLFL